MLRSDLAGWGYQQLVEPGRLARQPPAPRPTMQADQSGNDGDDDAHPGERQPRLLAQLRGQSHRAVVKRLDKEALIANVR